MKILKQSKQDPKDLEKLDSFLSKCSSDKKKPTGFIHYSDISKFGLKPIQEGGTPDQLTPLGIYGYPVFPGDKQRILEAKFSYAEGRNFIYLFYVKNQNKILYVENYNLSDFEKDLDKLIVFSESKNFKKINKESLLESAKKFNGPVAKKLYDFSFSLLRYSSEIFKDSLDADKNLSQLKYSYFRS